MQWMYIRFTDLFFMKSVQRIHLANDKLNKYT